MSYWCTGLPQRRMIAATQGPWTSGCLNDKVTTAAWHEKPSYFAVAGEDRMIDPHLQQTMAKDIGAHVTNVDSKGSRYMCRGERPRLA